MMRNSKKHLDIKHIIANFAAKTAQVRRTYPKARSAVKRYGNVLKVHDEIIILNQTALYMNKTRFLPAVLMALCAILVTGCDDDKGRDWNPSIGGEQKNVEKRTVVSEKGPKKGQKHRSSDDFSTKGMNSGKILWTCDDDNITFDVNINKSGTDGVFATSLYNNAVTDFISSDKLYIANPKNATQSFTITYRIIPDEGGYCYVTSSNSPLDGQEHRSSANFELGRSPRYIVECDADISFTIRQDVSGADKDVFTNVKNGAVLDNPYTEKLYIADPKDAKKSFTVIFKPSVDDTRNWMTALSDDLYLYELSIPGTHDSGTGEFVSAGMSKCQNYNIMQQLNDGIRYFDIRVDEEMDIRHGITDCDIDFKDVWNDFTLFLKEHPGETIIMQLNSHTDDDEIAESLAEYFKPENIWTGNSIPRLGEVRGKVVLFRRYKETDNGGIDVRSVWPDDGVKADGNNGHNIFYIEDRYYSTSEAIHNTREKRELVCAAIKAACDNDNNKMHIIFNSVAGRVTHTPWDYAWGGVGIEPEMNPALKQILDSIATDNKVRPLRMGAVLLDFYNKHRDDDDCKLVERIINFNFKEPFIKLE